MVSSVRLKMGKKILILNIPETAVKKSFPHNNEWQEY